MEVIKIRSDKCHALHFSPNGKFLAIGEYDTGYSIYSLATQKIVHQQKNGDIGAFRGFIMNIFFTKNNRLIVNTYDQVLNLPLPNSIVTNNHLIGAPVLSIKSPTGIISEDMHSDDNLITKKQVAEENEDTHSDNNLIAKEQMHEKSQDAPSDDDQSSNYSKESNPPASNSRTALKEKLQKYIDRIEGYQKPGKQIDFAKGFCFFKDSRAINRKGNYSVAKELLAQLNSQNDTELNIGYYVQQIEKIRSAFINSDKLSSGHNYPDRGINSNELKMILNEAKKMTKEEETSPDLLNSNASRFS